MTDGSWTLQQVDEVDSTNRRLLELARHGAVDRTVLVARRQTGGRGRGDKRWESPDGGLYLSALLRDVPGPVAPFLPLVAGEALVRTFVSLRLGVTAWLKWPNDLLVAAKGAAAPEGKAAGILVQTVARGERIDHAVVGIGVNLRTDPARLPHGTDPPAVSLRDHLADHPQADLFVDVLLGHLDAVLRLAAGAPARLVAAVERHLAWRGETVEATLSEGGTTAGRVIGLAADGALRLDVDGAERVLQPWDVAQLVRV